MKTEAQVAKEIIILVNKIINGKIKHIESIIEGDALIASLGSEESLIDLKIRSRVHAELKKTLNEINKSISDKIRIK